MRVVVVGATGNAGTALLRRLGREPDVDVVGVARRLPPRLEPPYHRAEWHSCDISGPSARSTLEGIFRGADVVVHLGWQIQPTHDQQALFRTNVHGSGAVVGAVVDASVPALVYASSVGAYAPGPKDREVDESWPTTGVPGSSYSRDKSTVEAMLDLVDPSVRVVRLRPALIFQRGLGGQMTRYFLGPLVPTRWLRNGRIPVVPTNPGLRLQAVHADDVADAYVAAIRSDVRGAFNLAAMPVLTPEVVAEQFRGQTIRVPGALLRGATAISWMARLQPVDRGWVDLALHAPLMSTERATTELGWRPSVNAVTALRELVRAVANGESGTSAPLSAEPRRPGRLSGMLRGRLAGTGNPY